jgi:hypothetical protein
MNPIKRHTIRCFLRTTFAVTHRPPSREHAHCLGFMQALPLQAFCFGATRSLCACVYSDTGAKVSHFCDPPTPLAMDVHLPLTAIKLQLTESLLTCFKLKSDNPSHISISMK